MYLMTKPLKRKREKETYLKLILNLAFIGLSFNFHEVKVTGCLFAGKLISRIVRKKSNTRVTFTLGR